MIGMGVLAFGLVIPTAISLIMGAVVSHHHRFKPSSVIINNYLGLLVALVAFVYINNGSHLLTKLGKNRPRLVGLRLFALLFITLGAIFTSLVVNYHVKHSQVYYLNTPLLIITFIIPTLFAWFVAILSAYEFGMYAKFIKGSLYRTALRQFSRGIIIVISGSVASEFVDNTFAAKVSNSLGSLLLAEYMLLAIIAVGLIVMALGAKKLKKIEEA